MLILSLDIETYGACAHNLHGDPLPPQTVFHPIKSLVVDQVAPDDLIQTVAITKVECPHPAPEWGDPQSWATRAQLAAPVSHSLLELPEFPDLAHIKPAETMVFLMGIKDHRRMLGEWLRKADVLLGHNIAYDILYLQHCGYRLGPPTRLIDNAILAYLQNEHRPERSLKAIANLLGVHTYQRTLGEGRFLNPTEPDSEGHTLQTYNAQDSHTTACVARELAVRIQDDYPQTSKLKATCLDYFSNCLWATVSKSTSGIHFDVPGLQQHEQTLNGKISRLVDVCRREHNLLLEGPGCRKSQADFVEELLAEHPALRHNKDLEFSDKQHVISWSNTNRSLFSEAIPPDHAHQEPLRLATEHSKSSKILNTYVRPLLNNPRKGIVRDGIAYGSWYIIPSSLKDDSAAEEGGQLQARPSIKNPPAQTFPPSIRDFYCSRYPRGCILSFDLSQAELRTAALLSGEPSLLRAYREQLNLHTERAKQLYGPDVEEREDFRILYGASKMFNFGDLYRAGADALKFQLKKKAGIDIPLATCEEVVATRRNTRPVLMEWQDNLLRFARRHHRVEIPFTGHSREFPGVTKHLDNEIVNFPIQAVSAITLWYIEQHITLHHLPNAPTTHMILNHYDALLFDCVDSHAANLLKGAILDALHDVTTNGYWAWISHLTGNVVPLTGDFTYYGAPSCTATPQSSDSSSERPFSKDKSLVSTTTSVVSSPR